MKPTQLSYFLMSQADLLVYESNSYLSFFEIWQRQSFGLKYKDQTVPTIGQDLQTRWVIENDPSKFNFTTQCPFHMQRKNEFYILIIHIVIWCKVMHMKRFTSSLISCKIGALRLGIPPPLWSKQSKERGVKAKVQKACCELHFVSIR